MKKILCVCLGNICRSPTAEGILQNTFEEKGFTEGTDFFLDSAGTGGWHVGEPPDKRSVLVCQKYGIDISNLRARKLEISDGERFDLLLGMDQENIFNIQEIIPQRYHQKIFLFDDSEVSDPYYGTEESFKQMFRQLKKASERWLNN